MYGNIGGAHKKLRDDTIFGTLILTGIVATMLNLLALEHFTLNFVIYYYLPGMLNGFFVVLISRLRSDRSYNHPQDATILNLLMYNCVVAWPLLCLVFYGYHLNDALVTWLKAPPKPKKSITVDEEIDQILKRLEKLQNKKGKL